MQTVSPSLGPVRLATRWLLRAQPDARLVALARAGHEAAFDAIVERYQGALRSYCRRFVAAGREEDVVQQTFFNAYRAMVAGEDPIELRPWLYAVARHAALDALRVEGWSHEPLDEDGDGVARPHEIVERRERLDEAVAAVRALPAPQRQAFVLHDLEGYSQHEIAKRLQLSEGAVGPLIQRARATLRRSAGALIPFEVITRLLASARQSKPGEG